MIIIHFGENYNTLLNLSDTPHTVRRNRQGIKCPLKPTISEGISTDIRKRFCQNIRSLIYNYICDPLRYNNYRKLDKLDLADSEESLKERL